MLGFAGDTGFGFVLFGGELFLLAFGLIWVLFVVLCYCDVVV